jgi:tight adherence protein B
LAAAGLLSGALPAVLIYSRRSVRKERLTQQLPDAFLAMSRGLKAGQSMPSVIQMIADDFPKPLCEEFTYYYEQQHLGVPHETALRDMARRVNVMEMRILTIALIVQRRAGGNLAELLMQHTLTGEYAGVQFRSKRRL